MPAWIKSTKVINVSLKRVEYRDPSPKGPYVLTADRMQEKL